MSAARRGLFGVLCVLSGGVLLAQQPAPPAQPAGESPYRIAGRLPVRIMSFAVEPTSIQPGEKVTLTWAVENPTSTSIDPIGRVAPRGRQTLSPGVTTTYTLSVTGASNSSDKRTVTVVVQGTMPAASPSDAAAGRPKAVPRTADGHPDLSGVYGYGAGGGRGAAPAAAAPGTLPTTPTLKPGAEKYRVVRGPEDTGLYSTCMPPGIPQSFSVPYYIQLVQAPKHVVVAHEYLNLYRIIPTDGRAQAADPDPSWMGHPVGRWDGDTLVVDSIGFNDKTEINGFRHTESLHVVERFSRPDVNTLQYEATIEDPNVFAGPWVLKRTFPLLPEYDSLNEFVCENNRDYKPLFGEQMKLAYHGTPKRYYEALDPLQPYVPEPFTREGFIHTTEGREAVPIVLTLHYKASDEPWVVLYIDQDRVRSPIRYDDPAEVFPHIYGPLNRDAIVAVMDIGRAPDGTFLKPEPL